MFDFYPTWSGVAVPDGLDGVDQWSALASSSGRTSGRTEILHNIDEDRTRGLFQVSGGRTRGLFQVRRGPGASSRLVEDRTRSLFQVSGGQEQGPLTG